MSLCVRIYSGHAGIFDYKTFGGPKEAASQGHGVSDLPTHGRPGALELRSGKSRSGKGTERRARTGSPA